MNFTRRILFAFAASALLACTDRATPDVSDADATSVETAGEWTTLLDADPASLENWEMYSQSEIEGWELVDGELHADGAGWDARKDLVTKQDYEDFELALEWRIDSANSSGIFYHVNKDGTHEIYELAPEYQVMDDRNWPAELEPNQKVAGNYAMHETAVDASRPFGEWNTTRIIVRGPHVEHWLNGQKVVEFEQGDADWQSRKAAGKWATVDDYASAKTGRIGLQNAGKVSYRNIRIREL